MTIVWFELPERFREFTVFPDGNGWVILTESPLTVENAADYRDAEIISTLNESDLSVEVLEQFPRLQHIATRTTGVDHIPLEYCASRGITISNVPYYGQQTVAEHTFALLLALAHRLPQELPRPMRGDFRPKGIPGFDLFGKTLGVIGTGNIGSRVVQIAKGFGMNVVAYDIRPNEDLALRFGFPYLSKEEVLLSCDILTLHVPGDESTYHLIGEREIQLMRPGAIIVNTARGTVVDIVALTAALLEGHLGGACIDVLPNECILRDSRKLLAHLQAPSAVAHELLAINKLMQLPNVVATSHMAYNTVEAMERILGTTADNIRQYLSKVPVNCV